MNLPGFSAESALGASSNNYRAPRTGSGSMTDTATGVLTLAFERPQSCTTTFRAYISHYFPKTVCELVVPDLALAPMATQTPISGGQRSKRSPKSFRIADRFLHCRTIAVPYIGEVKTTQSCDDAIPDLSVLTVVGHPELSTAWNGGINEIPPPHNPNWFELAGSPICDCCGARHKCPDGSCIPLNRSCTEFPA